MGLSGSTAGETLQDAEFDFRPGPQEDVVDVVSYRFLTAQRVVHTRKDGDTVIPIAEHDGLTSCGVCPEKWVPDVVIAQVWQEEVPDLVVEEVSAGSHLRRPKLDGPKPN